MSDQSGQSGLRDVRYCEVIPITRDGTTLTAWVYNTLGLNDCPACEWEALTEEQVNEAFGSVAAKLNGPRYWTLDGLVATESSDSGDTFTFGGIEMALRATIDMQLRDATPTEPYVPGEVERDTVYTFDAGKPVYELTSPEGDVYVMQSYAQITDPNLTMADLATLGDRLALPAEWTYTTRTLAEPLELVADGVAYVLQDELYNSYQRRT